MGKASKTLGFRGRSPAGAALRLLITVAAAWFGLVTPLIADGGDAAFAYAARLNGASLTQLTFAPFRRPEVGWEIYAPLIAHEIGSGSDATPPAFAARLAAWQSARGLKPTGVMGVDTFDALRNAWEARRPFVAASKRACPASPPETSQAVIPPANAYGGKVMLLRPAALAAYRRMLEAARSEVPALKSDPKLMTIFSAYRSIASDAARCAHEGNCQGVVRATCSAHLTGLAIDIDLGAAPGYPPDSSEDVNRLYVSRGAAYRWMVANAPRFGFEPYPFEPWHWEWTGETI